MEVDFYGVHGNPENIGFTLNWSKDGVGFGQLSIRQMLEDNSIEIDSECMGKEFVKEILCALVDNATMWE